MRKKSKFPPDCLEEIFGHLCGRDLLKCTLVCPEWNSFIGSTRQCMDKIKLNIKPHHSCLHDRRKINNYVERLQRRKWIHVSLCSKNYNNFNIFVDVMELFRTSPELHSKLTDFEWIHDEWSYINLNWFLMKQKNSLKVVKISRQMDLERLKIILPMPRLKELALGSYFIGDLKLAAEGLQPNLSLTHLHLPNDRNENASVKILLTLFPNVEFLKLWHVDDKTADSISEIGKNLKSLSVTNFFARKISNEAFYLNLEKLNCYYVYVFSHYSRELKNRMMSESDVPPHLL